MMGHRKIVAVITAITGDRVIVGFHEMKHAMRHFCLPQDIFLELLEKILKDPFEIYIDDSKQGKEYHLFYKLFDNMYILTIVKIIDDGAFFSSMYTTGEEIRNSHKKLKKFEI